MVPILVDGDRKTWAGRSLPHRAALRSVEGLVGAVPVRHSQAGSEKEFRVTEVDAVRMDAITGLKTGPRRDPRRLTRGAPRLPAH